MKDPYNPPVNRTPQSSIIDEALLILNTPEIEAFNNLENQYLMAVGDENRQVVDLSDSFAHFLGYENLADCIGKRPGELIKCIHAGENESGCGTSDYCYQCGVANAIDDASKSNSVIDRKCTVRYYKNGEIIDARFNIKALDYPVEGKKFTIFFIQLLS